MVVEVPKGLLGHAIEEFEMLLKRAVDFLGLHPHEFPKDEHAALDALQGLLIQLKGVAGLLGQDEIVVALEDAELIVEGVEVIADIVEELQDEEKEESEPKPVVEDKVEEPIVEPENVEVVSVEPVVVVKEEELIPKEPIEEEPKIDEEVEAEIEKDEVQEEAGKESREKIEALEAQLAALRKTIGD